jgi:hypothetical protein
MLDAIRLRRRAVDKNAIQAAWKDAGSDVRQVPIEALPEGRREEARRAASIVANASGQEVEAITEPIVPGAAKHVEIRLDVK